MWPVVAADTYPPWQESQLKAMGRAGLGSAGHRGLPQGSEVGER